jgi:hypothetical protein
MRITDKRAWDNLIAANWGGNSEEEARRSTYIDHGTFSMGYQEAKELQLSSNTTYEAQEANKILDLISLGGSYTGKDGVTKILDPQGNIVDEKTDDHLAKMELNGEGENVDKPEKKE